MNVLTVATRGAELAIAQTQIIISALKKTCPDIQIKIKKITTKGDTDKYTALWDLKSTGFFTSQVEDALLAGKADFAVHSFKDLPTQQRNGLTIAAICDRQFAEDCLMANDAINSIEQLPLSAKIGTSSLRRAAQIKHLRADLTPLSIRGNVPTRIKLLEQGKFDAVILARAGIERLGLGKKISLCFDPQQFIPAPAQGALAVQTRIDDPAVTKLIAAIDDKNLRAITFAERQVLVTMQCGCHAPVGAFAKIIGNDMEIRAFISDVEGENFISRRITGPAADANGLAEKIANDLLDAGGREILEKLEKQ
ncbi:MAG: hydroxymethylbilane synthase [Phycisphaerae bacterium]|nr:hydroxymethylbilane synthase [Phycisphaerae bacterium]MDD5381200.1 hydroxymethylbilane synthase [Phycisphaerae bacterium]